MISWNIIHRMLANSPVLWEKCKMLGWDKDLKLPNRQSYVSKGWKKKSEIQTGSRVGGKEARWGNLKDNSMKIMVWKAGTWVKYWWRWPGGRRGRKGQTRKLQGERSNENWSCCGGEEVKLLLETKGTVSYAVGVGVVRWSLSYISQESSCTSLFSI